MVTEAITIRVDPKAAQIYRSASRREQRVFGAWFAMRLRRATLPRRKNLTRIMDEIGRQAQRRGMSTEILRNIIGSSETRPLDHISLNG